MSTEESSNDNLATKLEEKLNYFRIQEVSLSDPNQLYSIREQIKETERRLFEARANKHHPEWKSELLSQGDSQDRVRQSRIATSLHIGLAATGVLFVCFSAWATMGLEGHPYFVLAAFIFGPIGISALILDRRGPFYVVSATAAYLMHLGFLSSARTSSAKAALPVSTTSKIVVVGGLFAGAAPMIASFSPEDQPIDFPDNEHSVRIQDSPVPGATYVDLPDDSTSPGGSTSEDIIIIEADESPVTPPDEKNAPKKKSKSSKVPSALPAIPKSLKTDLESSEALRRAVIQCTSPSPDVGVNVRLELTYQSPPQTLLIRVLSTDDSSVYPIPNPQCFHSVLEPIINLQGLGGFRGAIYLRALAPKR